LLKTKIGFLITDDYTSLYFQCTYMAIEIYKYFYKSGGILSQMKENFTSRGYGTDESA